MAASSTTRSPASRNSVAAGSEANPMTTTTYYGIPHPAIGSLLVAGEGRRLVAIKFGVDEKRLPRALEELHHELHGAFALVRSETKVAALMKQVRDYLANKRT